MSHIKDNTIYVVTMHRWGDDERYNYVLGSYTRPKIAHEFAKREVKKQLNEYGYIVTKCKINTDIRKSSEMIWSE